MFDLFDTRNRKNYLDENRPKYLDLYVNIYGNQNLRECDKKYDFVI